MQTTAESMVQKLTFLNFFLLVDAVLISGALVYAFATDRTCAAAEEGKSDQRGSASKQRKQNNKQR